MKYIKLLFILIGCVLHVTSPTRHPQVNKLYKRVPQVINKRSHIAAIDSDVEDIKESTDFEGRERKWKQVLKSGKLNGLDHSTLLNKKHVESYAKKAEIPHLEDVIIPEPEMIGEKRANIPHLDKAEEEEIQEAVKADDYEDEASDEVESGSSSGDDIAETESDVVKSDEVYEPERENTHGGKRRGSMKCEKKCSVPLEYHECAHPRCDLKIGSIKDLCFFLCKHQKERCEDVCE